MTLQQLLSPFRRALDDYNMITDGDKIAIGLSGGKDSVLLLYLFAALKRFYDKPFEITAINIDLGFSELQSEKNATQNEYGDTFGKDLSTAALGLKAECERLGVGFVSVKTDIGKIVFKDRNEKSPCSLCSKMRRGALITEAKKQGCTKLALGHHYDDLLETFVLSAFYEGRLSTFLPVTSLNDEHDISVIRPMIYIKEKNIRAFMRDKPVFKTPCPVDKHTQRQYAKELLKHINDAIPIAKDNLFNAITHPERSHLPQKPDNT